MDQDEHNAMKRRKKKDCQSMFMSWISANEEHIFR